MDGGITFVLLTGWAAASVKAFRRDSIETFTLAIFPILAGLCFLIQSSGGDTDLLNALIFNGFMLFFGIMYIVLGCRNIKLRQLNGGMAVLSLLLVTRFFDEDFGFLARGILILAQFAVPFSMIKSRENILNNGALFKFRTRPIDPADPFQGRYVLLGIDMDYISYPEDQKPDLDYKAAIFATLETNDDGFAHFTDWSRERPAKEDFLKTRNMGQHRIWIPESKKWIYKGMRLDIPFDRYYMEESKAPRAETLTREATRNTNCWVNVRILNGKAVIEDVFAEGQSLRDLATEKE
jgi:uncharacterized membrane-anchored protein